MLGEVLQPEVELGQRGEPLALKPQEDPLTQPHEAERVVIVDLVSERLGVDEHVRPFGDTAIAGGEAAKRKTPCDPPRFTCLERHLRALREEKAPLDRIVQHEALAGGPAQVDAIEVTAGELKLGALDHVEAAADQPIGVRGELGVQVAGALRQLDACVPQQWEEDLNAAREIAMVQKLLRGLTEQARDDRRRRGLGGRQEEGSRLGATPGLHQGLSCALAHAPTACFALQREAIKLSSAIECESLGRQVRG